MTLQNTFYVLAIVYMAVGLIIMLAIVAAVFTIKAKVNDIHRRIEEKLDAAAAVMQTGGKILDTFKEIRSRKER